MPNFARDAGRILLAASDPAELAFATNALTQAGYEVILAQSGEEALQLFRAQRPLLGIVEVDLKGLAVAELLPRVKAEPALADVPVMLLAGAAGPDSSTLELALDADGFLARTVDAPELVARVRSELRHAELTRKLRASESLLARAQAIAHLGSWELEVASGRLAWSDEVCRIFGVDRADFGNTYEAFLAAVHPDDRERMHASNQRTIAGVADMDIVHRVVRPDGTVRWVHELGSVDRDAAGKALCLTGTVMDITERRLGAEERDRVFELSLDMICIGSFEGLFIDVNPAWSAVLGWSAEELTGKPWLSFVHPDDHAATLRIGEELGQGRSVRGFENRYRHQDGSYRWLSWSSHPMMESRRIFTVARDVTAQHESVAQLEQSQRLQRLAGAVGRLGGWVVELADLTVIWSDEVCAIHEVPVGYRPAFEEAVDYYAPEGRAEIRLAAGRCAEDGTSFDIEIELVTRTGRRRWVRVIGEAVRNAANQIVRIQGATQDITERRQVEASLRASEALFRTVIQSSWDVFHLIAADGTILYESPSVTRVLGYLPEEMQGHNAFEFMHPDDIAAVTAPAVPSPDGSNVKVLRVRHKNGDWRWIESFEIDLTQHGDVRAYAVNYRDITERKQAEEALRASETQFRAMVNSISQLAWIATGDGHIHWYNQRWYDYTGTTPHEMQGWGWESVHDPARLPSVMEQWQAAIASGTELTMEFPLRAADGSFRTFLTRAVPIKDHAGKVVQWLGTNTDIDEMKRAEASLRQSEARLKDAQRIANLGSWDWNIITGELRWSDEIFRLFGIPETTFGRNYESFLRGVHPDDRAATNQAVVDALAGRAPYDIEHRTLSPDGSVRVLRERGEVQRDAAGRPVHMSGTVLDITESKQAETRLAETNRSLRMLSRCNEALIRSQEEGQLLATVCRIAVEECGFQMAWVGYAKDDQDKSIVAQAHAGFDDGYLAELRLSWADTPGSGQGPAAVAIRTGQPVVIPDLRIDPRFMTSDAALARGYHGVVCLPLVQAGGAIGVLVLYLPKARELEPQELWVLHELADNLAFGIINQRSQSDRQRLQVALQKVATSVSATAGANFFERLVASMVEALDARAGFVTRFLPGQPLTARTIGAMVDGRSLPTFDYVLAGTPCETNPDEEFRVVSGSAIARLFPDTAAFQGFGRHMYVGRRLDDSAGKPMGRVFVLFREPLRSTGFVSSTLQIFATRAAGELERQRADALLREQASLLDKAQDAILVRDLSHRIVYWNKSAERRYGWTAAEAIGRSALELLYWDPADCDVAFAATLAHGEWVGELRQRHKNGAPVATEGRWTLVRDDEGVATSIMAVNTDLSERKKLERTEEQLRQAQKMEAIGNLAGGVAHDFNNLLSVILSFSDLIIDDLSPGDPIRADLEEVKKAGLRATELTRQLLAFSRKQILEPVVLGLNDVVTSMQKMLVRLLGEDVELILLTASDLGLVHADAGQLEQVLMNLVVNARDAMPRGGHLTIETSNAVFVDRQAADEAGVEVGAYVMLSVTDTGVGMDRTTQERIFEPFFTTKDKSKGTGLGLSTVYGIVQQSGGHISVASELGQGTTFKVYLPASDRDLPPAALTDDAATSLRGSETILLVEDEDQVRNIVRTILRRAGYNVIEVQNGGEAFLVCEQHNDTIQLLLTDVVMPRMSGRQLAERLAPLRPQMRVLFVSGYTEDMIIHHGVHEAGIDFLAKPIMPEALLRKVRQVLDRPIGPKIRRP